MYIIVKINGKIRAVVLFREVSDLEDILELLSNLDDGSDVEVLISSKLPNESYLS